jgi:hypothetical protein
MIGFVLKVLDDLDSLEFRLGQKMDKFGVADDPWFVNEVQYVIAQGQMARHTREVDTNFVPWAPNSASWLMVKGNLPVGVYTGDMLSPANILGNVTTSRNGITVRYAGNPFDRQKLRWFEASGRKAWGLDEDIRANLREISREKLRRCIRGED